MAEAVGWVGITLPGGLDRVLSLRLRSVWAGRLWEIWLVGAASWLRVALMPREVTWPWLRVPFFRGKMARLLKYQRKIRLWGVHMSSGSPLLISLGPVGPSEANVQNDRPSLMRPATHLLRCCSVHGVRCHRGWHSQARCRCAGDPQPYFGL